MTYALLTYKDGSMALCRSTPAKIRRANEVSWMPHKPTVRQLTKREARHAYKNADLAIIESSIVEEFQ